MNTTTEGCPGRPGDGTRFAIACMLAAGVRDGDQARARRHLEALIAASPGACWHGQMEPRKAYRAEQFEIDEHIVRFRIERHPGSSWLIHRVQTWEVDVRTGKPGQATEEIQRLTEANVLGRAARMTDGEPGRGHASAALDYAVEIAKQNGDPLEEPDAQDIVLGWVALSLPARGRWPGRVAEMSAALKALSDPGEARAYAATLNADARALWAKCVAVTHSVRAVHRATAEQEGQ
jgi:hypothetical protein